MQQLLKLCAQADVVCVQETHSTEDSAAAWNHLEEFLPFWSHLVHNQAGVLTLIRKTFLNQFIYNEQSGMLPIATHPHRPRVVLRPGISVTMPVVIIDSSSTTFGGGEAHEVHKGYENIAEAQLVVDVIRRLTESSRMGDPVLTTSVGICTPYKRQVALIKYKLQQMTKQGGFKYNSVTVATADAFQGSERDYMIVSTVRTSTSGIEFAFSQKRLNVMLTRGKVLTVVVSNKSMFESRNMEGVINNVKTTPDARRGGEGCIRGARSPPPTHVNLQVHIMRW